MKTDHPQFVFCQVVINDTWDLIHHPITGSEIARYNQQNGLELAKNDLQEHP